MTDPIDAALRRAEHAPRIFAEFGCYSYESDPDSQFGVVRNTLTGAVSTAPGGFLQRPTALDELIVTGLDSTGHEDAHLALWKPGSGELRAFPDIRLRHDPIVIDPERRQAHLFATPLREWVTVDLGTPLDEASPNRSSGPWPADRLRAVRLGSQIALCATSTSPSHAYDPRTGALLGTFEGSLAGSREDSFFTVRGANLCDIEAPTFETRSTWSLPGSIRQVAVVDGFVRATVVADGLSTMVDLTDPPHIHTTDPEDVTNVSLAADGYRSTGVAGPRSGAYRTRVVDVVVDDSERVRTLVTTRREITSYADLPALVTAYGGFGVPHLLEHDPSAAAWCDLGGAHVIVQARGGGERGPQWQAAGVGSRKGRSCRDVIGAVRGLHARGVSSPGRTVLAGASLGGLVVSAAALLDPGCCTGVVANSALLDVHRYRDHPGGAAWIAEFGDPRDPAIRQAMNSYSPMHLASDAEPRTVPPFLLTSSGRDTRIDGDDAARFAAVLQRRGVDVHHRTFATSGHGRKPADEVHEFARQVLRFAAERTDLI